jgi:CheY-like chemotaxis protein
MTVLKGILRTLVVDDNQDFVRAVCGWIECEEGMIVVGTAENGRAGLSEVDRLHPDLVFIDVVMPEMDGVETTRRIKARPDPPAVVLFTMHDADAVRERALSAGADAVLSKRELGDALAPLVRSLRGQPDLSESRDS